jgi:hypothetical protein
MKTPKKNKPKKITSKAKASNRTHKAAKPLTPKQLQQLQEHIKAKYRGSSDVLANWATPPADNSVTTQWTNKDGEQVKLIKLIKNSPRRLVEYSDGTQAEYSLSQLSSGLFAHPHKITVAGRGYLGKTEVYSAAGVRRWLNIVTFEGKGTHKPVNEHWLCRANFLNWFVPKHEAAQKAYPNIVWVLESDLASWVSGRPAEYGPASCYLVPHHINLGLANLQRLGVSVEALLTGKTDKLPKGLSLDSNRNVLILTLNGQRWGTFANDGVGLLEGLELLTRLRVWELKEECSKYADVLDPNLLLELVQVHTMLFGGLVKEGGAA